MKEFFENLIELMDNVLEVYDHLFDGCVEFAECMAFMRELVVNFIKDACKEITND